MTPPPLDLQVVETLTKSCGRDGCLECAHLQPARDTLAALLAHARALREALREVHEANLTASNWLNFEYRDTPVAQRVAAMLAAAQDGPA